MITECVYGGLGRKIECTDQKGDKVFYDFNMLNQLEERRYVVQASAWETPESKDSFTYDGSNRLLTSNKGRYGIGTSCLYDNVGRKLIEKQTLNVDTVNAVDYTLVHTYDDDNRMTSCNLASGKSIVKTYTDRNQLETVSLDGVEQVSFTYDDARRESTRTFGNGLVSTKGYILGVVSRQATAGGQYI